MVAVTATVEVAQPVDTVFAYATDPTRFPEWQQGVLGGHLETPSRPEVGTHCVTVRRIGFVTRRITSEIIALDPPCVWSIRDTTGPIRTRVDVTLDPLPHERSRLTITVDFEGHGIGRLLVPVLVVPAARKEMPDNLDRLRVRLEEMER